MAALSNAWVCGRSLAGTVVSNPAGVRLSDVCECCVLSDRGLFVRPITRPEKSYQFGVSEYHHEALIMRRPWLTTDCAPSENDILRNNTLDTPLHANLVCLYVVIIKSPKSVLILVDH